MGPPRARSDRRPAPDREPGGAGHRPSGQRVGSGPRARCGLLRAVTPCAPAPSVGVRRPRESRIVGQSRGRRPSRTSDNSKKHGRPPRGQGPAPGRPGVGQGPYRACTDRFGPTRTETRRLAPGRGPPSGLRRGRTPDPATRRTCDVDHSPYASLLVEHSLKWPCRRRVVGAESGYRAMSPVGNRGRRRKARTARPTPRRRAHERHHRERHCRSQDAEERAAAAARRRQDAERRARERARERAAEIRRLARFFEVTGLNPAVWETFTQMVRSASGKAIKWGDLSPAHGDGLLVYARPRWESDGFNLAGVVCPDPGALATWPAELTILVPNQSWLSLIQTAARSPLKVAVLDPVTGRNSFVRVTPSSGRLDASPGERCGGQRGGSGPGEQGQQGDGVRLVGSEGAVVAVPGDRVGGAPREAALQLRVDDPVVGAADVGAGP